MSSPADTVDKFLEAIDRYGIPRPFKVVADGQLHRFPTSAGRGDDNGWYILYGGPIAAGAFGDMYRGVSEAFEWRNGRDYTEDEEHAFAVQMRRVKIYAEVGVEESGQDNDAGLIDRLLVLDDDPGAVSAPENEWLIEGWQPRGIGFTYGTTGYLKSFYEIWQAMTAAAGRAVFGRLPTAPLRTLIVHTEDNAERLRYDLARMAVRLGLTAAEKALVRDNVHVLPVPDLDLCFGVRKFGSLVASDVAGSMARVARHVRADLVLFDTISGLEPAGGDFGERAMSILRGFYGIMADAGCGVHGIAHVSKEVSRNDLRDVGAILGSSLYGNKCRVARYVAKPSAEELSAMPSVMRDFMDRAAFHGERAVVSVLGVSKISHAPPVEEIIWVGRSTSFLAIEPVVQVAEDRRERALAARKLQAKDVICKVLSGSSTSMSLRALELEAGMNGVARDMVRLMVEELTRAGIIVESEGQGSGKRGPKSRVLSIQHGNQVCS